MVAISSNETCGFSENALFKSYGDICSLSRSSSLLDELSMCKRNSCIQCHDCGFCHVL